MNLIEWWRGALPAPPNVPTPARDEPVDLVEDDETWVDGVHQREDDPTEGG